ncbi:VOC family protein [Chitinibacter tainanensis]|uniref:VOC family protein n=1 Tax=Chitinibacter tainanensis TaxID=230667 RepID=UPI00041932CF|nr:VOC family protein [Chitinibacter tainanensis]
MEARLSFVTLGVADLAIAVSFYRDTLGLTPKRILPEVAFFMLGPVCLALYPTELLAADAGVPAAGQGFRGVALAHNVRSPAEVDALLAQAAAGGGQLSKPGQATSWGGYAGYFADPDGHLWEVAWNPDFPLD